MNDTPASARATVDPRGPRFAAAISVVVLGLALLTLPGPLGVAAVLVQTVAFGLGAVVGLRAQPYGVVYRTLVAPRLRPPSEREDAAPPRFAQQVGLGFMVVAIVGLAFGWTAVTLVAVAFAFVAAFLNAVFDFCLGCEVYLLLHRP